MAAHKNKNNMRACGWQSARVPLGMIYDEHTTNVFGTPEEMEAYYEEHRGTDIHENYLEQIESVFSKIREKCMTPMWQRLHAEVNALTDTIELQVEITHAHIVLDIMSVRPCFERNSMLVIVVYQLLMLALVSLKSKVIMKRCLTKTVNILKGRFDDLDVMSVVQAYNEGWGLCCVFDDMEKVRARVNARVLGIEHRVVLASDGMVRLKRGGAFPTANELNNAKFVDAFFQRRVREQDPYVYERLESEEDEDE